MARTNLSMTDNLQDCSKTEGEDKLSSQLAVDFTRDAKVSSAVLQQLPEIVNKHWALKLSENKRNPLSEKYNRLENCEKPAAPKVNQKSGES